MEFGWEEEFNAFRQEVAAFARAHATPELLAEIDSEGEGAGGGALMQAVKTEIERRGWMKMCWPAEFGGEEKSPWFQFILTEELQNFGIPYSLGTAGMIGPAIQRFGTDEQKSTYLPALWSGELTCALGYSEPNAGTDLASLQTKAVRDGDDWVISGQKLWTSGAHRSTHVWLAARTDPEAPKHRGISMFIVPLDAPGVSIRPIHTFAGWRTNETFYDDVRVPGHALIGEENRGWYIAANALDHERVSIGGYNQLAQTYDRLVSFIKSTRPALLEKANVRLRLAELKIELHVVRALTLTNAAIVAAGGTPTMQASMVKVASSEYRYHLGSASMDILGRYGTLEPESGDITPEGGLFESTYRRAPILRFGGGTNEVQRNIISQRGLGLPRI